MKKFITVIFVIAFCIMSQSSVYAISAGYYCVLEPVTNEVVYEKNSTQKRSMASTTKIMTALLAIENCSLDDIVTVSYKASRQEGSSIYLKAGDKINLQDLIYGLMLNSGNDAAVAVAEHISGSVEEFAKLMTARANEIGAKNTQFKNPNGLDEDGHYTTAYDLALISAAAMKNEQFKQIVQTKSKTATLVDSSNKLYFNNHNKLLKLYDGANGIKTGYTKATGRCLVSSAERGGISFVVVTLNAPDDWNDHKTLLDKAFSEYSIYTAMNKGDVIKEYELNGEIVKFSLDKDIQLPCRNNKAYDIDFDIHFPDKLSGPINKGEKIGEVDIELNGKKIDSANIICNDDVYKSGYQIKKDSFMTYIQKICNFMLL